MSASQRLAFRLCLALGCPHPHRLAEEPWGLTAQEWMEWVSYWEIEPWGELRADLRSAICTAELSNRWRGKHEATLQPRHFMPFAEEASEPMSAESIDRALSCLF